MERVCFVDTFICEFNKLFGRYFCIDKRLVCDGVKNCVKGEDEMMNCISRIC